MVVPAVRDALNLTALTAGQWLAAVLVPILAVVWIDLAKLRHRR